MVDGQSTSDAKWGTRMTRYFFNICSVPDDSYDVGTECVDLDDARRKVAELLQTLMRDRLQGHHASVLVNVTDNDGKTVIVASATTSIAMVAGAPWGSVQS